jgi:hypothetical protein
MRLDRAAASVFLYDFGRHASEDLFPGAEVQVSPDGKWLAHPGFTNWPRALTP